jgi:MFS family permease
MGVASLLATERFQTTAEQLGSLAAAQLFAYAGMQIPVGLLLDRIGPRKMLALGAMLISSGQVVVAFSLHIEAAMVGRILVGVGDAFTFISLIRLINGWYSGKAASRLQQLLGNAGQLGQIVSAVPFAIILHMTNWSAAFALWSGLGLFIGVITFVLITDEREGNSQPQRISVSSMISTLRSNMRLASTKTAFWVHFCTMSPTTVLLLLWGVPFLVVGEGLNRELALSLLGSMVFIGLASGLSVGMICAKYPNARKVIVTWFVLIMLAGWAQVLLTPGRASLPQVILMLVVTAVAAPTSMIAFDYSREFTKKAELGATNGFVNIGGFLASFSMIFVVGVVLDVFYSLFGKALGLPLYSTQGFKWAFIVVFVVCGFGLWRYRANESKLRSMSRAE